jgi:hypothetical protein
MLHAEIDVINASMMTVVLNILFFMFSPLKFTIKVLIVLILFDERDFSNGKKVPPWIRASAAIYRGGRKALFPAVMGNLSKLLRALRSDF